MKAVTPDRLTVRCRVNFPQPVGSARRRRTQVVAVRNTPRTRTSTFPVLTIGIVEPQQHFRDHERSVPCTDIDRLARSHDAGTALDHSRISFWLPESRLNTVFSKSSSTAKGPGVSPQTTLRWTGWDRSSIAAVTRFYCRRARPASCNRGPQRRSDNILRESVMAEDRVGEVLRLPVHIHVVESDADAVAVYLPASPTSAPSA